MSWSQSETPAKPSPVVLGAIAVFALAGAAGTIVLQLASDNAGSEPGLQIALLVWIVLSYILSGLVAWYRTPDSRFGPLMIAAGFVTLLSSSSSANSDLVFTLGTEFDLIPFAVLMHVFLAFPTGELRSRGERILIAASYAIAVVPQVIELLLGGFGPDNLIAVVDAPELAVDLHNVQLIILAGLELAALGVLFSRRSAAGRSLRTPVKMLVNSFSLALVLSALLLIASTLTIAPETFLTLQRITFFVAGLLPIVFLFAILDARLARSAVGDLLVELRSEPAPTDLQEPLARALHDPTVTLAYWLPQYESWADQDGKRMHLPEPDEPRSVTLIDSEGEHLAALVHDPSLDAEPQLLEAVSAAAGIALENGRLQVELKAKLQELEGSRGRVIEAGQLERKRLERNLHDGAQQRLIALSLELGMLGGKLDDEPEAQAQIEAARDEIAVSLEELRAVARGLHPAVLSGHGLRVALESLVAVSPVPVNLNVEVDDRLDESVEVAAYYVVNESLANIGKHADAEQASVHVTREGDELIVEVIDDGVGGANSEDGTGLRGLADRVEALGGRLQVWTPNGGGTRVRAQMPCG